MALAIFPAFAIARTVVSRPWALFAAIGTIAAPALSYAPILVEEPFAYPIAVLALWLIVRAVERPEPARPLRLAAAACVVGMLTRSQLVALATTLVPRARGGRLVVAARAALARDLDDLGSGRSGRDRGWPGVRVLGAHGPLLAGVGRDHRLLEGADLRLRRLGGRRVRDRDRRDSRDRAAVGPGRSARRADAPGDAVIRPGRRCRDGLVLLVRRASRARTSRPCSRA